MSTQPDVPVQEETEAASLRSNKSFFNFIVTESFGAFNDNVFRQLVLLLAAGHLVMGVDFQTIVQLLFALPFLILSGLAGELSDRFSKGWLMVVCKVGEILVMLAGLAVFIVFAKVSTDVTTMLTLLAIVAFFMGAQSAFFGPPKYAGLPEFVRKDELQMATGITQMTTFLAIVIGFSTAGALMDLYSDKLYIAGWFMVAIAIIGTVTSLGIKRCRPSDPNRKISVSSMWNMLPVLKNIIKNDKLLFDVFVIYSWFWLVGSVALTAINNYGLFHLGMSNFGTSWMVALVSIGIAIGSVWVGKISGKKVWMGAIGPGFIGMVICMIAIAFIPVYQPTLADIEAANAGTSAIPLAPVSIRTMAFVVCALLGVSVGFFTVPLMTFVQRRPKEEDRGTVFAAFNWFSWLFIVAASVIYGLGMALTNYQAHYLLAGMGVLTAIVGYFYIRRIVTRLKDDTPDFVKI